jgi:hypothetical protein
VTGHDDESAWQRPSGTAADPPVPVVPPAPLPPPDPAWARPARSPEPPKPPADRTEFFDYGGPPPSNPPPPTWRPPLVNEPPAPRQLPIQDHERLDIEEQAAHTLSQGIGMVVGAIALVLVLILCARAVF